MVLPSILRRQLSSPRIFLSVGSGAFRGDLASSVRRLSPRRVLLSSPCLLMPPSAESKGRLLYKAYSPIEDGILSFRNKGGADEASLVLDDDTIWVGTSHGWLALFNSGNLYLLNPVSGRRISLPPYRGSPFKDEEINPLPLKVILSHSPDDEDCIAVMILGALDRAAFCRPGSDSAWSPVGRWYNSFRMARKIVYGDFAYSATRKLFLGCIRGLDDHYQSDEIEVYEHPTMDMCKVVSGPTAERSDPGIDWHTFMVPDDSGDIFVVKRLLVDQKSVDYSVYRIDLDVENVNLCSSLNGASIFIGMNHSFIVKDSTFHKLKPNSIYFSGIWLFPNQFTNRFDYHTKDYESWLDIAPEEKFAFHSVLHWFIPSARVKG